MSESATQPNSSEKLEPWTMTTKSVPTSPTSCASVEKSSSSNGTVPISNVIGSSATTADFSPTEKRLSSQREVYAYSRGLVTGVIFGGWLVFRLVWKELDRKGLM